MSLLTPYLNDEIKATCAIVEGAFGSGRHTLIREAASSFALHYIHADEIRSKKQRLRAKKTNNTGALSGKPRLTVIEGCDHLKEDFLNPFISGGRKVILICRDSNNLPRAITKVAHLVPVRPSQKEVVAFVEFQNAKSDAIPSFNSYTEARNWAFGGTPDLPSGSSPFAQAIEIFEGAKQSEHFPPSISSFELLKYYTKAHDAHPLMTSHLDLMLCKSPLHQKAARAILFDQRVKFASEKPAKKVLGASNDDYLSLRILSIE